MAEQGSGADGFERLARQYWSQWGEAMRAAAPASAPGWDEALGWWSQLARGGAAAGAGEAVSRLDSQVRGWFGRMQQVAARFAGREASATEVAQAWKDALGGQAGGPFAEVFRGIGGQGRHGIEHWIEQVAPLLQPSHADARGWLGLPAFGLAREHQERWQRLVQAQIDAQEQSQPYQALLAEAGQDAFVRFERRLEECSEPGRQLTSARALFDLWVDAAEEAYAEVALSPRFRDAYAAMVNAQMRLRARVQEQVEQVGELLGMPTRTEVDAAHRKVTQLERELRRLREQLQQDDRDGPAPAGAASRARARPASGKAAAGKHPPKKKAAAKKPTTKRPAARAGKPAGARKEKR